MPRWLFHPIIIIFVSIVATWSYISLIKTEQGMRRSTESVATLDQEVSKIAREVQNLEAEVENATSSATQETIIRDELLMKKPGEYVIQLPIIETNEQPNQDSSETYPWQEWQNLLLQSD
jgi:cell division protein FtsB